MGRKKKHAEETPPEDVPEPGAAASSGAGDDGPLPEDLEDGDEGEEHEEEDPPEAPKVSKAKKAEEAKAPVDPRAELRKRLGEPDPFPGAIIDPQTGRVENAPPGWDPKRRPPQKP